MLRTLRFTLAAATIGIPAALLSVSALRAEGNPVRAEAPAVAIQAQSPPAFATCKACHTVEKGGAARVGPNLFGVVGAKPGSKPGYAYSPAMKSAGFSWTRSNLDAYLTNPKGLVPGTKMVAPPITDPAKRKAVIDYLATLK